MATRGREVLLGRLYYRPRKGNGGLKKKKVVGAFSGMGGSSSGENTSKSISSQIMIFDDYEKVEKPGYKPKNVIKLDGAKIESSCTTPPGSSTNSPAYSSAITSPQGNVRLSASPSPSQSTSVNGSELYAFTVATNNGDVHEFRTESENERLRWVKLLQLLVMYPYSPIPKEPETNPIKDSFRQALEAKQYGADSVWPVYILPEEVGSKRGILGLHILALRSGVPNVSMGELDIISPSDHTHPVVTWDRDKMRRTGKTGHLVFIEIGRRCEGGPGLVWMYTGYQNDAQALRETLHKFLFHGDGRAIATNSQAQTLYDVPRSSVDSNSFSSQKRSSIPSGYHNHHLLTRSKSQDHDSGYISAGSGTGKTPPMLDGPPVRLDKHPSIRRKRESDPCLIRRSSSSVQSPPGSFNEKETSEPLFDCDDTSNPSHGLDEVEGYATGHMDRDSELGNNQRIYDVVRDPGARSNAVHSIYHPQAVAGDEYMHMIHPKTKYRNDGYVVMKPASQQSPEKSSTIPVPMPQVGSESSDEYNTLQHFTNSRSSRITNSMNYEQLPTITEREKDPKENYENHPLPQDLKGVMPRMYRPSYENHLEGSFRGRRGSHGKESYENMTASERDHAQDESLVNSNRNNDTSEQIHQKRKDRTEEVSLRNGGPSVVRSTLDS